MTPRRSFIDSLNDPASGWTRFFVIQGLSLAVSLIATVIAYANGYWVVGVLLLLIVALVIVALVQARRQTAQLVLVPDTEQPAKHAGLIVMIGRGRPNADPTEQAARYSIQHHLPALKRCWLLASSGAEGSLPFAPAFRTFCEQNGVQAEVREVRDAFGVQNTYEVVQQIYEKDAPRAGLPEHEVIADVTGATHPMAIGMALACGERRPMQYMTGTPYGEKGKVASTPRRLEFRRRARS
jgi:hypothetical protein